MNQHITHNEGFKRGASMPRVFISAAHKSSGKTTLTLGLCAALHARGWHFYKHIEPDIYRLMCSWAVTEQVLNEFVADVKAVREV